MLSLNTNTTSLIVQKNLKKATAGINKALLQLTTGYRINSAKDDPANFHIMRQMEVKLNAWNVAQDNINIGNNLLETASGGAELIYEHMTRIRNLCEQASNGTYGEQSKNAIREEVKGRLDEINRIIKVTEFNDISIFGDGISDNPISLQIGITSNQNSHIVVDTSLHVDELSTFSELDISSPETLDVIDSIINKLNIYQTKIGASQNRLEYALDYAELMINNITSSLSTIKDADIAKVSSDLIRHQILQQACITLLATANQMPAMALQLLPR